MKETHRLSATLYCIIKNVRVWMGNCWIDIDDDFDPMLESINERTEWLELSIMFALYRLIIMGCTNNLEIDLQFDPDSPDFQHYVVKNPIADLGFTVGNMSIEESRTLSMNISYETTTVVRSAVRSDIYEALMQLNF